MIEASLHAHTSIFFLTLHGILIFFMDYIVLHEALNIFYNKFKNRKKTHLKKQ